MDAASAASQCAHGLIPACAGVGLRFRHHQEVVEGCPRATWFEVHTENYMGGGSAPAYLDAIRQNYPISLHGVGLSLGSAERMDVRHLERVRDVIKRVEPGLVSEHLSWSINGGIYLADLLPLPMTEEALSIVCTHVDQAQAYLQRRISLENPSSYLRFRHSTIPEWEFLAEVARRTGCGILCDVNNIYVSASNHGWDALTYLEALPPESVTEVHLAGHSIRQLDQGQIIRIDDHGSRVAPPVWDLFELALKRFGPVPTLVEWDTDVPALEVLMEEAAIAETAIERQRNDNLCAHAA
ncbi:MNIO family bufferin maturase [Paraburkholderia sp. GAS32]|uniref:MNIO family bufferin maturase n=1 Tax=Paraburkholderia sp. GAS32 TaxID=3035129 RepID=UPI003D20809B